MRTAFIFIISLLLVTLTGISGNTDNSILMIGAAFADNADSASIVSDDDDELDEFWKSLNRGVEEESEENTEDEYAGEEEENEEESTPPESKSKDSDEDVDSSGNEQALKEDAKIDWSSVSGIKVPFFFLIDNESGEMDEDWEPTVAKLKARKYADQIINGIPFRIFTETKEVYLTENMTAVPEFIHLIDRVDYSGVARFDYEVLLPDGAKDRMALGRQVKAVAQLPGKSIAASFEASRRKALMEAVRRAFIKEKIAVGSDAEKEFTGRINYFQIVNEGWLQDENKFYIEVIAWVEFDL